MIISFLKELNFFFFKCVNQYILLIQTIPPKDNGGNDIGKHQRICNSEFHGMRLPKFTQIIYFNQELVFTFVAQVDLIIVRPALQQN